MTLALQVSAARALDEAELIRGFRAAAMSAEFGGDESREAARKFIRPVRFRFHALAQADRMVESHAFVGALSARVANLDVALAGPAARANFDVFVVDRRDYVATVGAQIYNRAIDRAPGRCVVSAFERRGRIDRAVAVIVADEGDAVFTRCLNEELTQGLGLLNDDPAAGDSVLNGRATPLNITASDLALLTILYDAQIKPGMAWRRVLPLLPAIIRQLPQNPGR